MRSNYGILVDLENLLDDDNAMIGELQRSHKRLTEKYSLLYEAIKKVHTSYGQYQYTVAMSALYNLAELPNTKLNKNE